MGGAGLWLLRVSVDALDGNLADNKEMSVERIDMSIIELVGRGKS
jgi:hypothetical protein